MASSPWVPGNTTAASAVPSSGVSERISEQAILECRLVASTPHRADGPSSGREALCSTELMHIVFHRHLRDYTQLYPQAARRPFSHLFARSSRSPNPGVSLRMIGWDGSSRRSNL